MNRSIRFTSLVLCAALLVGMLAACGTTASSSSGAAASSASSAASSEAASSAAASGSVPGSTTEANAPSVKNFDENSLFNITGTTDAFAPCLGWGPGVSGASLKQVIAAASLLNWAESTRLSRRTSDAIQEAYTEWYDSLTDLDKESFAEAWPMIKDSADSLLNDKDSMTDLIETAGLDPDTLPGCDAENWQALEDAIDPLVPESAGEY